MRREELSLPQPPGNDRPGDRWGCGRASSQRPCALGPGVKGICPNDSPCRPHRTWHGRRKIVSLTATVILIVALVAMTGNRYGAMTVKPGDLATPHAQILGATGTSNRCAACHPQAGASPLQWFYSSGSGHEGVSQTDRCLDCHHATIAPETARLAHNLPYRLRADLRLASLRPTQQSWHDRLPGPAVDQEDLQCSVCHREHRGAESDLLAISDSQCQTCHVDRFGSFASAHPEWDGWPYGRGREISFNHATHAGKHFPATARGLGVAQFQCVNCHRRTTDNELTRSTSYAEACRSCHDQALQLAAAEGVELLALPMLSTESASKIGSWPAAATGFYDGKVSPIAELLMRSEDDTAAAIRQLPTRDFAQIDPLSGAARQAAERIARAHRRLVQQIAERGQQAIIDRMVTLDVAPATRASFVQSLSPQLVEEANRRWFGDGPSSSGHSSASAERSSREVRSVQFQQKRAPPSRSTPLTSEDANDLLGGNQLRAADPLSRDPLADDPLAINEDDPDDSPAQCGWPHSPR
jgi:hypothetical protein